MLNFSGIMFIFSTVCTLMVALSVQLVWLLGKVISLITGYQIKYAPFGWITIVLSSIVILLFLYGYYIGRWQIKVKEVSSYSKDLPMEFDGFRIVHISDLHLSTFDDKPEKLKYFINKINEQNPDLICFTGDLVTLGREEAEPYTAILKQLKAPYGVVSVLGNHDFLIYRFKRFKTDKEWKMAVDSVADYERNVLGWKLLRNSFEVIRKENGSQITILGVDNKNTSHHGFRTIDCGDLSKATEGSPDGFRVLLTHEPGHWDEEVLNKTDIQLTLSGHTHASQIMIFGWTPASWMFPRAYGEYNENGQMLYVNPGLGCTAPFRIGAKAEITVITLVNKKKND